jgi:steroid delta-isomerase-like uncharacterized protein
MNGKAMQNEQQKRDDLIARNLAAVEAHFHNENPDDVDKAVALYTDDIVWESPARGQVYRSAAVTEAAYRDIFKSMRVTSITQLRQVATEDTVFTDHIIEATITDDLMPNQPMGTGTKISCRLAHLFEMRDGKISREIAYEMWREAGSDTDHDDIPPTAITLQL